MALKPKTNQYHMKRKTLQKYVKGALIAGLLGTTATQAAYTGFTVGYLIDGEDTLITAHIGSEIARQGDLFHGIEFEVGYTSDSYMGVDVDIVPLMVNYRFVNTAPKGYDLYFGLGAGMSRVDLSGYGVSDDDDTLTLQAFAGGELHLTKQLGMRIGYRYLYLDDIKLFGVSIDDVDDNIIEIGLSYLF